MKTISTINKFKSHVSSCCNIFNKMFDQIDRQTFIKMRVIFDDQMRIPIKNQVYDYVYQQMDELI